MAHAFSTLTFTPHVKEVQTEMGSRQAGEMLNQRGPANNQLGPDEKHFISLRDGFYMSTITENGWPYIQYRGGPAGFLHVIDEHTIAFADVTGNRQYISTGNLRTNPRVALFLMDYPTQSRLKILGEAEVTPWKDAGDWKLSLPLEPRARPERVIRIQSKPSTGTARNTSRPVGRSTNSNTPSSATASASSKKKIANSALN